MRVVSAASEAPARQPQGHRRRRSAARARGLHRRERQRHVVGRARHDLHRGERQLVAISSASSSERSPRSLVHQDPDILALTLHVPRPVVSLSHRRRSSVPSARDTVPPCRRAVPSGRPGRPIGPGRRSVSDWPALGMDPRGDRVEPSPARRAGGVSMSTGRLIVGDTVVTRGCDDNLDPCKLLSLWEPTSGLEPLTC